MRFSDTKVPCAADGLGIALLLVVVAGCGGPERAAVSGRVSLNDMPLTNGTITFQPLTKPAREHPAAWTTIVDGNFELPQEKGPGLDKCRVEIRSPKETNRIVPSAVPGADGGPGEPVKLMIEAVPARFNTDSKLVVEIQPGVNPFEFRLR